MKKRITRIFTLLLVICMACIGIPPLTFAEEETASSPAQTEEMREEEKPEQNEAQPDSSVEAEAPEDEKTEENGDGSEKAAEVKEAEGAEIVKEGSGGQEAEGDAQMAEDDVQEAEYAKEDSKEDLTSVEKTEGGEKEEVPSEEAPAGQDAAEEAEKETAATEEADILDFEYTATQADLMSYDILYIQKYANPEYVSVEELTMKPFTQPVSIAKGIATFNRIKQKDFDITSDIDNYIASADYQMPVYNVDDASDYYVAIPNINKFNDNFKAYDLKIAYNNDMAEMISGWRYEKGVLYIPKNVIDRPYNNTEIVDNFEIVVQLNYAIGESANYSKTIPVQVLTGELPEDMTAGVENMFDIGSVCVDTGVTNRSSSDMNVFLNGQIIPMTESAYSYDSRSGELTLSVMPAVISNINIVFRDQTMIEKLEAKAKSVAAAVAGSISDTAYADAYDNAIRPFNIGCLQDADGNEIEVKFSGGDLFTGWRGSYTVTKGYTSQNGAVTEDMGVAWGYLGDVMNSFGNIFPGYTNSLNFLYGAYVGGTGSPDRDLLSLWSLQLYASNKNPGTAAELGSSAYAQTFRKTDLNNETYTYTPYEWAMQYGTRLKKAESVPARQDNIVNNGVGGTNSFAIKFPLNKTITGMDYAPEGYDQTIHTYEGDQKVPEMMDDLVFNSSQLENMPWLAASCTHVGVSAGSGAVSDLRVYVTCLSKHSLARVPYAIFAFTTVSPGQQNATAIYKVKLMEDPEYVVTKTQDKPVIHINSDDPINYKITCYAASGLDSGSHTFHDDLANGLLILDPGSVQVNCEHGHIQGSASDILKDTNNDGITDRIDVTFYSDACHYDAYSHIQDWTVQPPAPTPKVTIEYSAAVDWDKLEASDIKVITNTVSGVNNADAGGRPTGNSTTSVVGADVKLINEVQGDLRDTTKEFEFEISLKGLDDRQHYYLPEGAEVTGAVVGSLSHNALGDSIIPDSKGEAVIAVKAKTAQHLTLKDLPIGTKYTVSEKASDHTSSFAITADGSAPVIVQQQKANPLNSTVLSTSEETINKPDGDVTITYTNTRNMAVVSGVESDHRWLIAAGVIVIMFALCLWLMLKKKARGEE